MKISYKPRLSGLCSIYGAKHRKVIAKGESVLEVQAGERTIVLTLEYCHPDQEAEQLLQVAVSQLDKPFSGKLGGRMEILKLVLPAFSTFLAVNFI